MPPSVGLHISPAPNTHDTAGSAAGWRHQAMSFGLACLLLCVCQYRFARTSGVHPISEGEAMNTRRTSYLLMAVVASALMLAPCRGAALPPETDLEPIPVKGELSPDGRFVGTITIES